MANFGLEDDETIEALPPPYLPRGAAWDLFYKKALTTTAGEEVPLTQVDELLFDGPAGTGKTLAILWLMHSIAMEFPGTNLLFCRNVRESMTATCLRTFEAQVLASDPEAGPIMGGRDRSQRESYKYPNGSRITLMGVVDVERAKSAEYDIIYLNEATEVQVGSYEILTTRIRPSTAGQSCPYKLLICDTNPSYPDHYLNTRFMPECNLPAKRVRLISRHKDNPRYWDLERDCPTEEGAPYIRKLESLTGARRRRMLDGEWCGEEGLVYEEFDPHHHIIDRASVPPIVYYVGAHDPSPSSNNAAVLQIWGIDADSIGYMVAETHMIGKGIDWWGEEMVRLYHKYRPKQVACDPSNPGMIELFNNRIGSSRGNPVSRIAIKANNDKPAGIAQVKSALTRARHLKTCPSDCEIVAPHGKARMYFVRDALTQRDLEKDKGSDNRPRTTVQEMLRLPWKKTKDGQPAKDEWEPNVPHDGCDCVRYFAMFNEQRGLGTKRAKSVNPYQPGTPGWDMWKEGRFDKKRRSA